MTEAEVFIPNTPERIRLRYRKEKVEEAARHFVKGLAALSACYDEDLTGHWAEIEQAQALEGHLQRRRDALRKELRQA